MLPHVLRAVTLVFAVQRSDSRSLSAPVQECLPEWAKPSIANGTAIICPYGTLLLGQVTFSYTYQKENPGWHLLALFLSYVPFIISFCAVLELCIKRGTRELNFVCFMCFVLALNEGCMKRLVKQKRPDGSCNITCGMPSSHATISTGYLTLLFLDLSFRVSPLTGSVLRRFRGQDAVANDDHTALGALRFCCWGDWTSVVPISNSSSISNGQFVAMFFFWIFLLGSVPISRVILKDHSIEQVNWGSFAGFCEATCWFFVMREVTWKLQDHVGTTWPRGWRIPLLRHDYVVPRHEQIIDMMNREVHMAREILASELRQPCSQISGMDGSSMMGSHSAPAGTVELHARH